MKPAAQHSVTRRTKMSTRSFPPLAVAETKHVDFDSLWCYLPIDIGSDEGGV